MNKDYPDPCEYCPMMYLAKSYNCRKDCKELKEAAKQWAKDKEDDQTN